MYEDEMLEELEGEDEGKHWWILKDCWITWRYIEKLMKENTNTWLIILRYTEDLFVW